MEYIGEGAENTLYPLWFLNALTGEVLDNYTSHVSYDGTKIIKVDNSSPFIINTLNDEFLRVTDVQGNLKAFIFYVEG